MLIYLFKNLLETKGKNELEIRYLFVDKKKYIVFNPSYIEDIEQKNAAVSNNQLLINSEASFGKYKSIEKGSIEIQLAEDENNSFEPNSDNSGNYFQDG